MIHEDIKTQSAAMPVHSGVTNQEGCNRTPLTDASASDMIGEVFIDRIFHMVQRENIAQRENIQKSRV